MGVNLGHWMGFPGKIRMEPGWVIWKDFWSEIVMARCSGDQVEFWLGSQKKDVAWLNRQVQVRELYI